MYVVFKKDRAIPMGMRPSWAKLCRPFMDAHWGDVVEATRALSPAEISIAHFAREVLDSFMLARPHSAGAINKAVEAKRVDQLRKRSGLSHRDVRSVS